MILALRWLLANWRLAAYVLSAVILFGSGFHLGTAHVHSQWDNSLAEQQRSVEAERERLQQAANQKSAALERLAAAQREKVSQLTRRLEDEIKSHSAYAACVVTDDGVRLNNEVRAGHRPTTR